MNKEEETHSPSFLLNIKTGGNLPLDSLFRCFHEPAQCSVVPSESGALEIQLDLIDMKYDWLQSCLPLPGLATRTNRD